VWRVDPLVVQARMRHSKFSTTQEHYDRMGATAKQRAALAKTPRRAISAG